MDRSAHLHWCKERALEYWREGDLVNAVASMGSDLSKHPETRPNPHILALGMQHVIDNDGFKILKWIEGFN